MTAVPLLCVSCGYALEGLAEDGICPECATSVAQSVAAHTRTLRPLDSAIFTGAIGLLLVPTTLLPLVGASIFIDWGPVTISQGQITTVLGLLLLWHCGWWILASREPLRPFGAAYEPRGGLVRLLTIVSLVFTGALGVILDPGVSQHLRPMVGGWMFSWLMRLAGFGVLPLLAAVQVCAGAPILHRFATHRPPGNLKGRRPRGVALERLAAVTTVFLLINLAMTVYPPFSMRLKNYVLAGLLGCAVFLVLGLVGALLRAATDLRHAWVHARRTVRAGGACELREPV